MIFNYRIIIEHNYHNKGRCRISAYNLTTRRVNRGRYIEDTPESIEKYKEDLTETIETYWDGQVVQEIEK